MKGKTFEAAAGAAGSPSSPPQLRSTCPSNTAFSCERRIDEGGREAPAFEPPLVSCNALFDGGTRIAKVIAADAR